MTTSAEIVFPAAGTVHPTHAGAPTISHQSGVRNSHRRACHYSSATIDRIASTASAALLIVGCAPALDWRTLSLPESPLQVQFPCRPAGMSREVPLSGATVRWTLHACDAKGMTFGVAWADVPSGASTEGVLRELAAQARENLRATPAAPPQAASVPGMTPNPAAQWWHWQGRSPAGGRLAQQQLLFVHGTRAYQASVVGGALDGDAARNFFDALRVQP